MKNNTGKQAIGCRVTSCMHNEMGTDCALSHIDVLPGSNVDTGNPADESLCGSYSIRH